MTLTNPAEMTVILEGSQDDSSINVGDIGFNFPFYDGIYRSNIFVGSNSYITFGFGSSEYRNLSYANPGRGILITASDRSYQRVYTLITPGELHIRFEGSTGTSGTVGNPDTVWEVTLFESGNIRVETGVCENTSGSSLITNGSSNFTNYEISAYAVVELRRSSNNAYTIAGPPTTPRNPTPNNSATNINSNGTLLWDSNGSSFNLELGQNNPPPIIALELTTASYELKNLTAGTTYFWRVTAQNSEGTTAGPIWSFTIATLPPPIPNAPTNLQTALVTGQRVSLTWDSQSGTISNYQVWRNNFLIGIPPNNSHIDTNVDANTTYTYTVSAVNSSGESLLSNPLIITTPDTAALNSLKSAQIKFHITNARLEQTRTRLYSSGEITLINNQLQKCEYTFDLTRLNTGSLIADREEITKGGITVNSNYPTRWGTSTTTTTYGDSTKTFSKRRTYQQRLDDYYSEVELLRQILEP